MLITISMSKRFFQDASYLIRYFMMHGNRVLLPRIKNKYLTKEQLKEQFFKKIDRADCLYVYNKDGKIGESVLLEILYAKKIGKSVYYFKAM